MSFRKIVRFLCLGAVFSFLGSADTTLAQGEVAPRFFKGVDPLFPPPKDFISELMMTPKRTLVFMETDQLTGTKFSLVRIIGGLPGGTPCVGGVNWPVGYEIVGEVPEEIGLFIDAVAKPLVERGKDALFNFCPEASKTETIAVWLFKGRVPTYRSSNYEVFASWETQLPAAPGPRIKVEYHNQALERIERSSRELAEKERSRLPSSTLNEVDSRNLPTISHRTYMEMRYGKYAKPIIIGLILFVILLLIFSSLDKNRKAVSVYSDGGYSSYNYSEPDSEPEVNSTCRVCHGSGKCQNDFHPDGLLESVFVGGMTDLLSPHGCPACGRNTEDPGKCSICGGSGEA